MTLLATFKHISSKNADYGAAEAYLTFEHDEFTMKATLEMCIRDRYELDEDGNRIRDQNGEFVFNAVPTTDWGLSLIHI